MIYIGYESKKRNLNEALKVLGKEVCRTSPVELYHSVLFVGTGDAEITCAAADLTNNEERKDTGILALVCSALFFRGSDNDTKALVETLTDFRLCQVYFSGGFRALGARLFGWFGPPPEGGFRAAYDQLAQLDSAEAMPLHQNIKNQFPFSTQPSITNSPRDYPTAFLINGSSISGILRKMIFCTLQDNGEMVQKNPVFLLKRW